MENILRAIFLAVLAVFGLMINVNLTTQAQTFHYLKEDLEVAVHDAALELKDSELSKGKIVFDQTKAKATITKSFEKNSELQAGKYKLEQIVFLDDSTVDSFPVTYTSPDGKYKDTFKAATIVAIVKGKKDVYFSEKHSGEVKRIASYTYKPKANTNADGMNYPVQKFTGTPNEHGFIWPSPFTQRTTSQMGMRTHPITGIQKLHAGVDIADAGVNGTPAVAAKAGTVTYASPLSTYGNLVIVDHGKGVQTRYAHLSGFNTTVGAKVEQGQVIGFVGNTGGSTGPHLHFEIRIDGTPYNPMIFYQ